MRKLTIISMLGALLFVSCTKDLSSLNVDPKHSTTAIPNPLFTQGELNLANAYTSTAVRLSPFRVLSQEWTEYTYTYEANYNFSAYNSPGGFWTNSYVNVIHNLQQAKDGYASTIGPAAMLRNSEDITDLLIIFQYQMLVATYGDIPYSKAENVEDPFPAYDDAKTVYLDLLTRIDTCIAGMDPGQPAMGAADLIYGGDVGQWVKFAATLKLKMAMLLADVDPATATTKANEAIATGVFMSNDDNALFKYDAASPINSNPIWNALEYSGRHDFLPSDFLVTTMVGLNDPRVPLYFTEYPDGSGKYLGGIAGNTNSAGYGSFSDFTAPFYDPATSGDLMDYAETEFYLAEAAARGFTADLPATHYNNAITASIEFWGGTSADAATYLAMPNVAYATAPGTWRQKIGYQEWIADYNLNWDSWTTIRRLGQPNINVVSPPTQPASDFPLRYYYPPNEATSNSVNYNAAVAKIPGAKDVVTAMLFWEIPHP